MSTAMALADTDWIPDAVAWIESQPIGSVLTADDLRQHFRTPPTPNAVGNAFKAALAHKAIRVTGYRLSSSPTRKGSLIRVWERIEGAHA